MAINRYWRAVGLEAYAAGDLELVSFHLLDAAGARVDASAALTASIAPDAGGVVENLHDGAMTTTTRWSGKAVKELSLMWDFGGTPVDVNGIQLSGPAQTRFLLFAQVQESNDGLVWNSSAVAQGISWSGPLQPSTVSWGSDFDPYAGSVISNMLFEGNIQDLTGRNWSGPVGAYESAGFGLARKFGSFSEALTSPKIVMGALDWTLEMQVKITPITGKYAWLVSQDAIGLSETRGFQLLYGEAEQCFLGSLSASSMPSFNGPTISNSAISGKYLFVVFQRRGDVLSISVDGVVRHSPVASGYVVPDKGATPLTIGATNLNTLTDGPFTMQALRFTLGAARYTSDFSAPVGFENGVNGLNLVRGRVAPVELLTLGGGPVVTYGVPLLSPVMRLTVESGAVNDYTSGVLGKGIGRVAGTVKEKGTPDAPVYRKVRLIREKDGLQMREVWSHPVTGAYSFDHVDELQKFTVLSYDHTGAFRAVVADGQIQELIA